MKNSFSSLKIDTPDVDTTIKLIKTFDIKIGREWTGLYISTDVLLLADVYRESVKDSQKTYGLIL